MVRQLHFKSTIIYVMTKDRLHNMIFINQIFIYVSTNHTHVHYCIHQTNNVYAHKINSLVNVLTKSQQV